MMSKVNSPVVFLPIECTLREFDYKLNLARFFLHAGFDVMLGNPPFIRDELQYKNYQDMFLEKGGNPDSNYYSNLHKKNVVLFCLSDEGAAFPAFSVSYKPAVDALKKMENIFLWGEFQKNDLISRNGDLDLNSRYVVTGYPGLEFSLPKYKNYNRKLSPRSLPNEYILVNTNFSMYNGLTVADNVEACPTMSPETLALIEEMANHEKETFNSFYEWLIEIIKKFPDEQFLIRPHPLEDKKKYVEYFSNFNNVLVSKDGTINQALSRAKIVLHRDCTSALQGYIMGLPVISLAKSCYKNIHSPWALSFSAQPESTDETISIIAFILANNKLESTLAERINFTAQRELSERFCNLGNSTQDILSIILPKMRNDLKNFVPYKIIDTRTTMQKFKVRIRRLLPLHYKVPIAARRRLLPFSKREIEIRMNLLEEIDGLHVDCRIKKLFPNVYYISSGNPK